MADQVQIDPAEARRQIVAQLREMADRMEASERHINGFTITTLRHDADNWETVFRIAEIVTESERRAYLEAGGR